MAYLLELATNKKCYLEAHHSFGRLLFSVNTLLPTPEISKIHALIEWDGKQWNIRDISRNGTWLNGRKLKENKQTILHINDTLGFSEDKNVAFLVLDLNAPVDYLYPLEEPASLEGEVILLNDYCLLPSENNPELVLHFDKVQTRWTFQKILENSDESHPIEHNDIVKISNKRWQLKINQAELPTENLIAPKKFLNQCSFLFELSQDEENTHLKINCSDRHYNLQIRAHHYLTLHLARLRAKDHLEGIDVYNQGWTYTEQLADELGIDISHINIQIHRVRKQFVDKLESVIDSEQVIQRRPGEIRFGGCAIKIVKAGTLECDINEQNIAGELN